MNELRMITDRIEIDALRSECADATAMNDLDRLVRLFTDDAVVRVPELKIEWKGLDQLRTGFSQVMESVTKLIQNSHPGVVEITGDTATGRDYIFELGRRADGSTIENHAIFHDHYRRTHDGWKFSERDYEVRFDLARKPAD